MKRFALYDVDDDLCCLRCNQMSLVVLVVLKYIMFVEIYFLRNRKPVVVLSQLLIVRASSVPSSDGV